MTAPRSEIVLCTVVSIWLLLFVVVAAGVVGAAERPAVPADRDGDGSPGEATAIRERARLYHRRHGIDGRMSSAQALERAHWTEARWYEKLRTDAQDQPGWINLGPVNGAGRCTSVAPHPVVDGTLLAGAAGGGLWQTIDGGLSWMPLTDSIPDLSVGAVAYAPSDPQLIYLGTGEGGYAGDFIPGIGLLRSLDGGQTWLLPDSALASQFFALSVRPEDGASLLAATNQGLFASTDGGVSWQTSIGGNQLVGVSEVLRSSADPDLVYAALWCASTCPDGLGRVMRSSDGGVSWEAADSGLPPASFNSPSANRLSLAVAPSDGQILYAGAYTGASAEEPQEAVYRSIDGGSSWVQTGATGPFLMAQGWYDNTITVHPQDPDVVIAGGIIYVVSADGGASWMARDPIANGGDGMGTDTIPHVDAQDLQWQGDTLWLACDGGIWFSVDNGLTWTARNDTLVTRQYYGMALDPMRRDRVLAGTQDNGTDLRDDGGSNTWSMVMDSDGFECAINPLIPDYMYGTLYFAQVYRNTNGGVGDWQRVFLPLGDERASFFTPLTMRSEAPWELYTGTTSVWHSRDAGDNWQRLPTVVENGGWNNGTVAAVATTPADSSRLMAAKEDQVYASLNGGQTWWATGMGANVNNVDISSLEPDRALACLAQTASGSDQLMRSTDGGISWFASGSGLPPFSVQVARWHPVEADTAYAGTDVGLYRSTDGGASWSEVGEGLPAASIHDLRISADGARLVAASHGRGVWELAFEQPPNQPPTIQISAPADGTAAVLGEQTAFAAAALDSDGDSLAVSWIFSDFWQMADGGSGEGAVDSLVAHTFERGGDYLVAAHVSDGRGGSAVHTINVSAFEPGDDCVSPRVIPPAGPFPVIVQSENYSATEAETDPEVPCVSTDDDPTSGRWGSVWFELTPEASASYVISTCGSSADTVLSAWTGPACGPYVQVTDGCNDDDDFMHCTGARTDSYLELDLEAGTTYRFMVGSWGGGYQGAFRFNAECVECSGADPQRSYLIPAAAHSEGSHETTWVTDLSLFNPGQTTVTALLAFQPGDGASTGGEDSAVTVGVGASVDLVDVVAGVLGASGSGAIRVLATSELLISSRTYNLTDAGTYGQGIPGAAVEAAVAPGGAARLIGLAGNQDFRTNIGLASAEEVPVSVTIELHDHNGVVLSSRDEQLPAHGWRQLNRIFELEDLDEVDSAFAVVRNTSVAGGLFTYASVVDEASGDPTYVTATEVVTPDASLWVPAAAHVGGVGDSLWRTDLMLANIGALDLDCTIELFASQRDNREHPEESVRVAAGTTRTLEDVLFDLFGHASTAALRITVDRGHLVATSRTYTVAEVGSYGQFIPAVNETSASIDDGEVAALLQLRSDEDFRTNLGMVNLTGQYLGVSVRYYHGNGEFIGARNYTLLPYSHRQINGAVPGDGTTAGFAQVRATTTGGRLLAYASVVDNGSDDSVYIPAVVYE